MDRYRLLDPPHKGIRHLLGQWALATGNTDVHNADELAALKSLTNRVVFLLEDHARNEEEWIFPLAESRAPGSTTHILAEHEDMDNLLAQVATRIYALGAESTLEEVSGVYLALTHFQAHYLLHLLEEEQNFEPLLWSLYTDEELQEAEAKVAQNLDPQVLLMWFAVCVPARSIPEDAAVLRNIRQVLPTEQFDSVLAAIEPELPLERFSALLNEL